jgi:hypothetical protein
MHTEKAVLLTILLLTGAIFLINSQSIAQSCSGQVLCTVQLTSGSNGGIGPSTNGQEIVYVTNEGFIVSNIRGVLDKGSFPDISATGEVVYIKEITDSDGSQHVYVFSTTRGQLTFKEYPSGFAPIAWPSINSSGEVVYVERDSQNQPQIFSTVRGQLTFFTEGVSSGEPEIDDTGRVVFTKPEPNSSITNIWEIDTQGNIRQLTFYTDPERTVQPTLAAETGELVYVLVNNQTSVLSLVSERDGTLFVAPPDPGVNFGVFPDLSPQGMLVFLGLAGSNYQTWLGIRASDGAGKVCSFNGIVCPLVPLVVNIDIMPGKFPNKINLKSKADIPVAILTTNNFDATTTVDASTVLFGATGTEATPVGVTPKDVNQDGFSDLLLNFITQQTGIQCRDTSASLTGQTSSGQEIEGVDAIQTVGCK